MTFKKKITISTLSVGLVVTLILLVTGNLVLFYVTEGTVKNNLETIARTLLRQIELNIKNAEEALKRAATGRVFLDYHRTFRDLALKEYFSKFQSLFAEMAYVNENGEVEVKLVNGQPVEDGLGRFNKKWLKRNLVPDKIYVEPASYYPELNSYGIRMFLLKRSYFGNEFQGILTAVFKLNFRLEGIEKNLKKEHLYILFFDGSGNRISLNKDDKYKGIDIRNIPTGISQINIGEGFIVCRRDMTKAGLSMLVLFPIKNLWARMKTFAIFSVIAFFVVFGIQMFLLLRIAEEMSSPLVKLSDLTQKISKGNLKERIEDVTGLDEIKYLSSSFNRMLDELEQTVVMKDYVENIINSIKDALLITNTDGIIINANSSVKSLTGYEVNELLSKSVDMIFEEKLFSDKSLVLLSDDKITIDTTLKRKDDRKVPVLVNITPLRGDNYGERVFLIKDITDIKESERKIRLVNEQLKAKNRELQEFAYIASHDLQEPLRKVSAFSERIMTKYAHMLDRQGKDYLERMINATKRMQDLINGLLTYSRVTTKAEPFVKVDLNEIIKDVLDDLEVVISQNNATIEVKKLPILEADPLQMRQLFQNLISNSIKFRKPSEPPRIRIELNETSAKDICEIIVRDNGMGFAPQYSERIFGVFQRLHSRSEYKGTGIGLAICKKIVERHGGSIYAESEEGKGARFFIKLPLVHSKPEVNNEVANAEV